ncbi:MAG TPA: hypothetical protein VF692_13755 [Pyrinomonadaceae bacterium]
MSAGVVLVSANVAVVNVTVTVGGANGNGASEAAGGGVVKSN